LRGRKPKPLNLQVAEGDTRKKGTLKVKAALAAQPKSARGLPHAPKSLTSRERIEYKGIKEAIEELNLAEHADSKVVALAAIACAEARTTKTGQALRTALAYLSNLGLAGPASRARLSAPTETGVSDLMTLLSAPREAKKPHIQ
jgi:hypothetical protein